MGLLQLPLIFSLVAAVFFPALSHVDEFISIDCGGAANYTDPATGLKWVSDSGIMGSGKTVNIGQQNAGPTQYMTRRDFPVDAAKYCYSLPTQQRRRYLVRATFQYASSNGSDDGADTYPKFQLYLDTTKWTTVTIFEASRLYVKEMIVMAPADSVDVCLCCPTTGAPFISTLELRPLNYSIYATDFEDRFFLGVAARVNFGAATKDALRYPDDPYDRIWDSDLAKRQNFLVGVASGTERINTSKNIDIATREYPPMKVMQTAVVGTENVLSYRLNLDDFPANARAYAYLAEIEDLGPNETRKFRLAEPNLGNYNNAIVNIIENANGRSYALYEPSYMNVSLEFILSFAFKKTPDSTRGPLLNAIEISRYVEIAPKTDNRDLTALKAFRAMLGGSVLLENGDPCLPIAWEWVSCSLTTVPRVTKIDLSGKNIQGSIPSTINEMTGLTELWFDGNAFTGTIPDMSKLEGLEIMHLENNKLTGHLPSYLGDLPKLRELYIENNSISGVIPRTLLGRGIKFEYSGNPDLHGGSEKKVRRRWILGASIGFLVIVLMLVVGSLFVLQKSRRRKVQARKPGKGDSLRVSAKASSAYSVAHLREEGVSYHIALSDIEEATGYFSRKIGKGSFGTVYHGKMKDGKEVAVKMMGDSSINGNEQFTTEIALLSRIHHRNLVPLIGYCKEEDQCILVYEYMHHGTLRDHIHDPVKQKNLSWISRLTIAEDAAKGLDYLHTGCSPSIIHRDVKTSNILLDIHMRAKVSDFGLSRQAEEDLTHVSSVARGTVGYLDPEYYANQQLTEKSDVYSFGVVLLELISGRKPVSAENYGADWSIVHWARSLIRKGDVLSIVDPILAGSYKIESIWRIAEVALQCVEQHGSSRPRMQEIVLAIQDAIKIERACDQNGQKLSPGSSRAQSSRKTLLTSFLEIESPDLSNGCMIPSAR